MDYKIDIEKLIEAPNVCDLMSDEQVDHVGRRALEGYQEDLATRADWSARMEKAMNLAMQLVEKKTFPWDDCANVKFPLLTVAALQYHARAYPALISGTSVFQARVIGDATPDREARAERLSRHMSWQALEQDDCWEEEMDKALLIQPIMGSVFVKDVFDPRKRRLRTMAVHPRDLVVSYKTKDLETSQRYTHRFYRSPNYIRSCIVDKTFRNLDLKPLVAVEEQGGEQVDRREGMIAAGQSSQFYIGEQHCWWDFDGDGFDEPYIVTFDIPTGKVWRIVARYDAKDVIYRGEDVYDITPINMFTAYPFIPSPDGGIYGLGLGALAAPINHSVNTVLNQLIDAGTMATLGGGFLGRGFKGRGGPVSFRPHEWQQMDGYGDDIRKAVMPLPIREPSAVLFQVLGFLVEYGERIVSSTEIQVGASPGQNQKAETTRILNENGQRVYTGVYKRSWRALRHQAIVRYEMNRRYLTVDRDYNTLTKGQMILEGDYQVDDVFVRPAADPTVVSEEQKRQQAAIVLQNAMSLPGHNRYKAMVKFYRAQGIAYEDFLAKPMDAQGKQVDDYPPPPDPKMLDLQIKQRAQQLKETEFQSTALENRIKLQREIEESYARTTELYAKAALESAQAESEKVEPTIKLLYAQIESEGKRRDILLKALDTLVKIKGTTSESTGTGELGSTTQGNGMGGMETALANAAVSGSTAPATPGVAGAMGNGGVSIQ